MSSIEPDNNGSKMDGAKEVACGLVVADGNAAILIELAEELRNQMTCPVQVLVVVARLLAAALGRNQDYVNQSTMRQRLCWYGSHYWRQVPFALPSR